MIGLPQLILLALMTPVVTPVVLLMTLVASQVTPMTLNRLLETGRPGF